jgi:tetratricopeptide (TPR) repeat protein/transcriptional regulator with XRE-family HTH domain
MVSAGGASSLGAALRQLRRERGLSQRDLLRPLSLGSHSVIVDWEAGRRIPPADVLTAYERYFELPPGQLLALRKQALAERAAVEARRLSPPHVGPAIPQVRYALPADTSAFTGRDDELRRITAMVADAAVAGGVVAVSAIDGMPGVGKTALAVHAAHVLAGQFPDRQLFVDLHGYTPGHDPVTAEDALAGLLAATGVDPGHLPGDLAGRTALWRDKMAGQKALLVLDNAASSGQVAPLLPGGGSCLVLVTSRRHLGDLPGAVTPVLLDALPPEEAADMFTRLVPRTAGQRVGEVVALAGYLPLAISLLARVFAGHPSWTLADLVAETRGEVLTMAAEQDSVAAAFEVSYRHLDPAAQQLFWLLGVHPGTTIDSYAAAALAGMNLAGAAGLLDRLHREGLVTEAGHRWYGMHDLLRRYARDLAAEDPAQSDRARGRLLDYYQRAAAVAGAQQARATRPGGAPSSPARFEVPELGDSARALAWARANRANLITCLDLSESFGQHAHVVTLTAGLATVLRRDGPWAEAITRHSAAVRAARHIGDRLCEANALTDLGDARQLAGDHAAAAAALIEALGIYRDLGEALGEANALCDLGIVWRINGDFPGAAQVVEQALDIYRNVGDRLGEANALRHLAAAKRLTGDYPGAAQILEQALGFYRDLGDRIGEANALNDLGHMRQLTGDYPGAAMAMAEALAIYRDLAEPLGEANALLYLGMVRQVTGDYRGAAEVFEEALVIYRDLGERLGVANVLLYLGTGRQATSDYPGAATALAEALAHYRDIGSRLGEANALSNLGAVRRSTGDFPGAALVLEEALGIYRDLGDRPGEAEALNEQGTLHRVRGDLAAADECHQRALDLARLIGSSRDEAIALAGQGRCALTGGHAIQAELLLRQAHEIFERIGAAEAHDVVTELNSLTRMGSAS